jgi:hypothetical protein
MSRIAKATGVALGAGAMALSGAGLAMADAGAEGAAVHSPGVLSGNVVQVPVHVPVNVCGNTVNVIALLNPAFGNTCINGDGHEVYDEEAETDEAESKDKAVEESKADDGGYGG